jgi:hypothetical protein
MMPAQLPEAARQKLSALTVQRIGAEDAARSANMRLNNLGRDADKQLQDELTKERDRHSERHRRLSLLINKINEFVMKLPASATLEPMVITDIDLKKGETLQQALERVRAEITAINGRLGVVRRAPLPAFDQKKLAEEFVERLARLPGPTVGVVNDTLRVGWRDSVVGSTDEVLAVLAWAAPELVRAALIRSIDAQPVPIAPMHAGERRELVAKLEGLLKQHEIVEECLVQKMYAAGLVDTMRRVDIVNLGVVLGIAIAKMQAKVA